VEKAMRESFTDTKTRAMNSLRAFLGEVRFSVAVLLSRLGDGDSGKGGMFSLFPSGFKSVDVLVVLIRFAVGVTSGVGRSRGQEGESVEDWDRLPSTEPCMACYDGERSASWVILKDSCTGLGTECTVPTPRGTMSTANNASSMMVVVETKAWSG
jgi:hypothetical protein